MRLSSALAREGELPDAPRILRTYGVVADLLSVQRDQVIDFIGSAHWGAVGEHREELLRALLEAHLPARVRVSHGFIVRSDMIASRELDIIVWDKSNHAALFESGRFAIVSPKSVIGVIEVKTTLDCGEAEDAAAKIRSAKELLPPDARTPMFGAIFGYKTASTFESLLRGVQTGVGTTERDLLSRLAPDMVVSLDRPLLSVAGSVRLVVAGQATEVPVLVNYVPTVAGPEGRTENLGPMSLLAQLLFGIDHFWVRGQSVAEALITDAPDVVQGVAAQYSGFGRGEPLIWTLGVLTPDEEVRMNEVRRLWGESLASQ